MRLDFPQSPRSTLGIEWELMCVDRRSGELRPAAPEILAKVGSDTSKFPHATVEFQTNTVELATAPHSRVADAVADLAGVLESVRNAAEPLGVDLIGGGTHPFAQWFRQHLTPNKPRYEKVLERAQWWARQMLIWGVHVHIGVDDKQKAIPLLNALLTYYPHFQGLSASSPFWASERTGYASNRALIYQQLNTAGMPPLLKDWDEFESMVGDLVRAGVIDDATELRWDIRPSSRWGTLEVRIFDGVATLDEVGALAALTQCVVEDLSSRMDAGEEPVVLQQWYLRENKWRAARYGLDATIITNREGDQAPLRDELRQLIARLEPTAERLGCLNELRFALTILESGAGYERQLAAAEASDGSLKAVVAHLTAELRDGIQPVG
ncbi:glutamate--cysteine ligase [Diaminobutyricimonas sp. LJ205]|uniref:glutamate--cysteine ligase n=1 Tax=Diaminobutyricimonas sp. LJ205 TaxID=2683590 RepID=UPI0012F4BCEC|nr:glutamate--cysteine ligase [Diaminobutyricimonas sp. LJ205]